MEEIIYLGFRSFEEHSRGVENVVKVQTEAWSGKKYYISWAERSSIKKYGKIICISIKKDLFWVLRYLLILIKLDYKNKYIHAHNGLMLFFTPKKVNIYSVHDTISYLAKNQKKKFLFIYKFIEFINYTKSKHIHCVSKFTINQIPSVFKNKSVIYNVSRFEDRNHLKNNNINIESPRAIIIRSIEVRSNLNLIIDFAKANKYMHIDVYGKGPLLMDMRHTVAKDNLTNIIFHGFVNDDELFKSLIKADIMIVPALWGEGFGLPVIEAYSVGLDVVASNVCALPEVIYSKDYLFEPSVKYLESAIKKNFISKSNVQDYYYSNFSKFIIVNKYKQLYNKC